MTPTDCSSSSRGGPSKVLASGATTTTVFLDISSKVLSGGEQGLLGLTFHPQFGSTNARFFVNYTRKGDGVSGHRRISRIGRIPMSTEASEIVLLIIAQPFMPTTMAA